VAEAKEHLRIVDMTTDDEAFDDFVDLRIGLPRPPVRLHATAASATVTISYVDQGGTTQTLTWAQSGTQQFRLDRDHVPSLVYPEYLENWPSVRLDDKAVQVTYLAGYGGAANVPTPAKHAIKMLVGHWYANRESVLVGSISKELEFAVSALLANLRWRQYA